MTESTEIVGGPDEVTEVADYESTPFAARARRTARTHGIALAVVGFLSGGAALSWGLTFLLAFAVLQFAAGHGVFRRQLWGVGLFALDVGLALSGSLLLLSGTWPVERTLALGLGIPALILGAVALPGAIRLLRDAERQYTVGRWT